MYILFVEYIPVSFSYADILEPFAFNIKLFMQVSHSVVVIVEVDLLWNRTVDWLKTSFHPLLWTSSGLKLSLGYTFHIPLGSGHAQWSCYSPYKVLLSAIPSDLMKSTVVDES